MLQTGCATQESEIDSTADSLAETQQIVIPSTLPDGFSFTVPAGFQTTQSSGFQEYYVFNDASIIVTGEKMTIAGERLENYVKTVRQSYERTADQFQLIEEKQQTVNGQNCTTLEFTYTIVGEDTQVNLHCLTAVLLANDWAYLVTCKSKHETYYSYAALFQAAIESIVLTDPEKTEESVPDMTTTLSGLQ